MSNFCLLTICIPTYNRSEKVVNMVEDILYHRSDVKIVIIDNCSSILHLAEIKKLIHPNLKIVTRDNNIGGNANITDAYSYSDTKYSLLCLDKDYIDINYLDELLELLTKNDKIIHGQILTNPITSKKSIFLPKGFKTLQKWGFDCAHPSGFFLCNSILKELGLVERILLHCSDFPFTTDLIKVHLIMKGDGYVLNAPLIRTETLYESAENKSYTYSGNNVWFLPHNIIYRMSLFILETLTLDLDRRELRRMIQKIFLRNLIDATFGYKKLINNDNICKHHGLIKRKLGSIHILKTYIDFQRFFWSFNLPLNYFEKGCILICALTKFSILLILRKL